MIRADEVATLVEWFFENHTAQDIYAVPVALDATTNSVGTVSYSQQISGLYGIFTNIVKEANLSVRYFVSPASYHGMPMQLLHVFVNLQYTLMSGGSNGNALVELRFDAAGKYGPNLIEYKFEGQEPVIVDEMFALPKVEAIVADPANVMLPKENAARYAMISYLVHNADAANLEPVFQYVERFQMEYRIMFIRNVLQFQPNLITHPTFTSKLEEFSRMLLAP